MSGGRDNRILLRSIRQRRWVVETIRNLPRFHERWWPFFVKAAALKLVRGSAISNWFPLDR
jgi:hypothetical protein